MSSSDACTVKYQGRTHSLTSGLTGDLKSELHALTAVPPECQRLIVGGKVLTDGDLVAPNAKVMMMRCAAQPKVLRLSVREIVRLALGLGKCTRRASCVAAGVRARGRR